MMSLELPRINVLPKVDILQKCERKKVDRFPGFPTGRRRGLISHSQAGHRENMWLTDAIGSLQYGLAPLGASDPDSVSLARCPRSTTPSKYGERLADRTRGTTRIFHVDRGNTTLD
jgi:hypothetical protein